MNLISVLLEEIRNISSSIKELRKFGLSVGIVLLVLGLVLFYFDYVSSYYLGGIGLFLILSGLTFPKILLPAQKAWMALAVILGFIMTRIILTILFIFVVTPVKIIASISGKKFLDVKIEKSAETYWNYRERKDYEQIQTERQF